VLGQCWASSETNQLSDLKGLNALTEAEFCALPSIQRFGMTWQEYGEGRHYSVVWVAKLFAGRGDAPKHRGMLSVDVEGDHLGELKKVLNGHGEQVRALLTMCEGILW
jgi:hypothetical protein